MITINANLERVPPGACQSTGGAKVLLGIPGRTTQNSGLLFKEIRCFK